MGNEYDEVKVKELKLSDLTRCEELFAEAVKSYLGMERDIDLGNIPEGSKLKLKLDIDFIHDGSSVDVEVSGGITMPKFKSQSFNAQASRGKLVFMKATQPELPGIHRPVRVVEEG